MRSVIAQALVAIAILGFLSVAVAVVPLIAGLFSPAVDYGAERASVILVVLYNALVNLGEPDWLVGPVYLVGWAAVIENLSRIATALQHRKSEAA